MTITRSLPTRLALVAGCAFLLGTHGARAQASGGASNPANSANPDQNTPYTSATGQDNAATTTNRSAMPNSSGKLGFMDRRFVTKAADDGHDEVQLAQLAAKQAENPDIRSFAEKIIQDHTAVNAEISSLASGKNLKLDNEDAQDRTYRRLSKKTGYEFDQEFVEHMIDGHEKAIKMFEKASQDAKDPEVRTFAAKHLDDLRRHLQLAQGLRSSLLPTGRESKVGGGRPDATDAKPSYNSNEDSATPGTPAPSSATTSNKPAG